MVHLSVFSPGLSVVAHSVVVFENRGEGIFVSEAGKVVQQFLHVFFFSCELLPGLPLLHQS